MVTFKWHVGEVPQNIKIKQVYGVLFSNDGRVILKIEKECENLKYSLAGGTPEIYDKDIEATLRRELLEEINTEIEKPILIGYQEVNEENGNEIYAQVRMVAKIKRINAKKPDPDNGKTYDRILTNPEKAIKLINWGEEGKMQIEEAKRIANKILGIHEFNSNEELV